MVNMVVREWLRIEIGEEQAFSGIRKELRRLLTAFYADKGLTASRDPVLLQQAVTTLITLSESVGLITNTKKTEAMNCIASKIRVSIFREAYHNRLEGHHGFRDHQRRRVTCDVCKADLTAGSLKAHIQSCHNVFWSFVLNPDILLEDQPPVIYHARQVTRTGHCPCPVDGCPVDALKTAPSLRRHFHN